MKKLPKDIENIEDADDERSLFAEYYEEPSAPTSMDLEIEKHRELFLSSTDIAMDPIEFWRTDSMNQRFPNYRK